MTLRASLALLGAATVAGWLAFTACRRQPSEIPLGGGTPTETLIAQPSRPRAAAPEPIDAGSAAPAAKADGGARKKRDASLDAGRRDAAAQSDAGRGSKGR